MTAYRSLQAPPGKARVEIPEWPQSRPLRSWQRTAMEAIEQHRGDSFLASATPAAGKTTFGLAVAHRMLRAGRVRRVVVLGPTTHICRQWATDAARYGIDLEPNRPNSDGTEPADRHGIAVTYQTVAASHRPHRRAAERRATLLIADEPHHMGDAATWGRRARAAFDSATFRLLLSGTPFRSDTDAIPWVRYDENGLSVADYIYGYPDALIDRVCRPISFVPYDGEMEWVSEGRLHTADFETPLPTPESARRLRTALDPEGDWMGEVLRDADLRLERVRDAHSDAGGLVIASDQDHARAIAKRLEHVSDERPEIVMSDEPGASTRIAQFAGSDRRWLVSVLMVSEGVDIPRLRVGVYATAARTELFFRQVVGRFIRRTENPREQMSYLLIPADARLKRLAFEVEEERRHALERGAVETGEESELEEPGDLPSDGDRQSDFAVLSSGAAEAGEAILSQTTLQLFPTEDGPAVQPTGQDAEPTVHPPHGGSSVGSAGVGGPPESAHEARERLRRRRRSLVTEVARRSGESHREVHARVNRATGVRSVSNATRKQLEKGNELLFRELRR